MASIVYPSTSGTLALLSDITAGTSGTSGVDGTSGINGTSGLNGTSGTSGATGSSGATGTSGTSGTSGSTPNPNATYTQDYTATTGQASFAVTGGYTVGQLAVYYNGSKLAANEYTATNGTSFTLATACQSNDIVQAVASVTGGGMGGSGTTNYIPKFTASGVIGNSLIFDNGTNVGIGTSSPSTIGGYRVLSMLGGAGSILELKAGSGATSLIYSNNVGLNLTAQGSLHMLFLIDFVEKARLNNNGTFSIGNTNSTYNLDVTGTGRFTDALTIGSGNALKLNRGANDYYWSINSDSSNYLNFGTYLANGTAYGTNPKLILLDSGNVGIGTTSPSFSDFSTNTLGINISNQSTNYAGLKLTGNTAYTTGSFGLYSGSAAHYLWGGGANPMIFATNDAERMRITSGGNVLIGTTTNNGARLNIGTSGEGISITRTGGNASIRGVSDLVIEGGTSTAPIYLNVYGGGSVVVGSLGTGTVYSNGGTLTNTNPSDSTLKNTIQPLTYGLNEILQLQPKTFYYNSDSTKSSLKYGFIAQEVQQIMPDMVRKIEPNNPDTKLGLESDGIYVTLVKAIQELSQEVNELKSKLA